MITPRQNLYKNELARMLNISVKTLSRFIDTHKEQITKVFPTYKSRSQILYPKVIDYIVTEMGYSHEEIYRPTEHNNGQ